MVTRLDWPEWWQWEVIVEPDPPDRLLVIITAYRLDLP
jgi:hypothetical protein